MPFCFRWRISPFGAASTASSGVCASLSLLCPVRPAGGSDKACLPLDLVVRCSSACGTEFRVLASWRSLLVPCSLYSPATEILSFFLEFFEVVSEGFLPPTAGRSLIGGTSVCSSPLPLWPSGWRLRSFATTAGSHAGMDGRLSSPPLGVADGDDFCTLNALCIDQNLFAVNPGLF